MELTIRDIIAIITVVILVAGSLIHAGQLKEQLTNKSNKTEVAVLKEKTENIEKDVDEIKKDVKEILRQLSK